MCESRADARRTHIKGAMESIAARTRSLLAEIDRLARQSGRREGSVTLVGIGKGHTAAGIREAWQGGLRHAGESYVQEALPKMEALGALGMTWHFVGRIQANKTAAIAEHFDWVHSIDRERIARRLSDQRPIDHAPLECCLEVNLSGEAGKGGVSPEELPALCATVAALPRLRLRGLMVLPAPSGEFARQRQVFGQAAELLGELRGAYPGLDTLSMGMSGDMEAAITAGATLVRIGTALFGERARTGNGGDRR